MEGPAELLVKASNHQTAYTKAGLKVQGHALSIEGTTANKPSFMLAPIGDVVLSQSLISSVQTRTSR